MNKVFMVGRFVSDPQPFVTQNGITQARFTLAVDDNWKSSESYFFPCVAWQSNANFINNYIKKGDLVSIDGKLIRRSYDGKDGNKVYVTDVVVENIKILSKSGNSKNQDLTKVNYENNYNKPSYENKTNYEEQKVQEQLESFENLNKYENDDPFSVSTANMHSEISTVNLSDDNDENEDIVSLDWLKEFANQD